MLAVLQRYLQRLAQLLPAAYQDPNSPEAAELHILVQAHVSLLFFS